LDDVPAMHAHHIKLYKSKEFWKLPNDMHTIYRQTTNSSKNMTTTHSSERFQRSRYLLNSSPTSPEVECKQITFRRWWTEFCVRFDFAAHAVKRGLRYLSSYTCECARPWVRRSATEATDIISCFRFRSGSREKQWQLPWAARLNSPCPRWLRSPVPSSTERCENERRFAV